MLARDDPHIDALLQGDQGRVPTAELWRCPKCLADRVFLSLPVKEKLISQMTLEEKAGQLTILADTVRPCNPDINPEATWTEAGAHPNISAASL